MQAHHRSTLPRPAAVDFYVAAQGHHYMTEIARMFADGTARLGLPVTVRSDEVPQMDPEPGRIQVVVAPHEYFPLFLQRRLAPAECWAAAAACYCLNTEQPGGPWFEGAAFVGSCSRGVFDINRLGVREFRRRGIPAAYAPLGYCGILEELPAGDPPQKDIDILFLGHYSQRRAQWLARHASVLQQYRCRLILAEVVPPQDGLTPGSTAGTARNALLRRSKILINLHSAQRRYFEWHRALCAMANRCLLVSEPSDGLDPLVPDKHLLLAHPDRLMDLCQQYLQDEAARQTLVDQAYTLLHQELSIDPSCRLVSEAQELFAAAHAPGRIWQRAARRLRRIPHAVQARCESALQRAHRLPGRAYRYLHRQPAARRLYGLAARCWDWLTIDRRLEEVERRQAAILGRLELVAAQQAAGAPPPYDVIANPAYAEGQQPGISVVVTVYNYAHFVGECLESVAQAHSNTIPGGLELVVVDDASTDRSVDVVQEQIRGMSLPARLVRKHLNTGLSDARNIGARLARAPFVFILDADNAIFPDGLARLHETIRTQKAAAAYGILQRFDSRTGKALDLLSCIAWDVSHLVSAPCIDAMALLDRRTLLEVGGYSTELLRHGWGWEDYELWLRLAQAGYKWAFCPELVGRYRVHRGGMSRISRIHSLRLAAHFRQKYADLALRHATGDKLFSLQVEPQWRQRAMEAVAARAGQPAIANHRRADGAAGLSDLAPRHESRQHLRITAERRPST